MPENDALVPDSKAELVYLQEELEVRDQLVQQLSEELFRLIQTSSYFNPDTDSTALPSAPSVPAALPEAEDTWGNEDETIAAKDEEIFQLRHLVMELRERCQLLETVIQEFPDIYRRKFSERIQPIRDKILTLQRENHHLRHELQLAQEQLAYAQSASAAVNPGISNFSTAN